MSGAASVRACLLLALGAVTAGCHAPRRAHGEDDIAMPESSSVAPATSAIAEAPEPALPPGSLARSRVDAWLRRGPPYFLQKVGVSPVLHGSKFAGWRVDRLSGDFEGSGLQQGDVVTSANGMPIESQDDFFDVWRKMSEADELRIAYERNGKAAESVLKIVGAPDPETKHELDAGAPPPTASKSRKQLPKRGTIVITDESGAPISEGE